MSASGTAGPSRVPCSAGDDAAAAAVAEARARGWCVVLAGGRAMLAAPLATLSPSLVDRLAERADEIAELLRGEQER